MKKITHSIILGDNALNWFLGAAMVLVPTWFNSLLSSRLLLPIWLYFIVGVGFLWFASWQVQTFLREKQLPPAALQQAALLAWGPVVVLTIALLTPLTSSLYPFARVLLWIGNGYMLVLGGWYWWVAKQLLRDRPVT